MQNKLYFFGVMIIMLFILPDNILAGGLKAEAIISKSWSLYRTATDEQERISVVITRQNNRREEKEFIRWIKYSADGDKIVVKFIKPRKDRNLGLLTWRNPVKKDQHWLRMPSWKKVRRISVNKETKYFGGTDLTFEDTRQLIGERIRDFDYRVVDSDQNHWLIEALPKKGVKTGYGKRMFWINRDFSLRQIDFFKKNGTLLKRMINQNIEINENGRWRAGKTEIKNFSLKRTTLLEVRNRSIDTELKSYIFTKRFLLKKL